jgi:stage V sporulation protein B
VVLAILTISLIVLRNGVRQALSRTIARNPGGARQILTHAILIQSCIALLVALIVFVLAGPFSRFFDDADLLLPLRICPAIIFSVGLLEVFLGSLNGLKRFFAENLVFATYSTARAFCALILIYLGFQVVGAICGFLVASVVAAGLGASMLKGLSNDPVGRRETRLLAPSISTMLIFGALGLLMDIDLLFVKYFMVTSNSAGLYTAAGVFSKLAFFFVLPFGVVALPFVASSFAHEDLHQCKIYLSQTLRYSTLMFLPVVVIVATTSKNLLVFFYDFEYALAYLPLSILVFGLWFFGIISIFSHVMIAIGQERLMALMTLCTIAVDIVLNCILVPHFGLKGGAVATSLSGLLLLLACGSYVVKKIGFDIRIQSVVRVVSLLTIRHSPACRIHYPIWRICFGTHYHTGDRSRRLGVFERTLSIKT